jgi:hypothetical protein
MYKLYGKLILKWIVKYEKDLGITKLVLKRLNKNQLNFTKIGKNYDVDSTTSWIS